VSLPTPLPGLVIRYSYLWAADAARGLEEGDKDRPAVIILVVEGTVLALPVTHSAPTVGGVAMEIPPAVARSAGLDEHGHGSFCRCPTNSYGRGSTYGSFRAAHRRPWRTDF
jgi:hypothetical protein